MNKYFLETAKQNIIANIKKILPGASLNSDDFSNPPKPDFGDLSLSLFNLAKGAGLDPSEAGDKIIASFPIANGVSGVKIAGPFLNFFLDKKMLIVETLKEIIEQKEKYGFWESEKKEKIILEFSNGNTHKEVHIGHLRNICYGEAITKILQAAGAEAIPVSYINDFGIHVAKTLANFNDYLQKNSIKISELPENERGYILGKIYADAAQREKDDEVFKQLAAGYKKKIEAREGEEYKMWQETREWSISHFADIYKKLGINFSEIFYESDFINAGLELMKKLLADGILKESEGAIIADLEKYNLGVLVIARTDGTAMYPVGDLALAEGKKEKLHPDKSIYIVDARQSLYFKQLFKILELAGHQEKLIHLSYDFVKLPSGLMSSRSGNVITFNELYEEIIIKASGEIKKRRDDWDEEKIKKISEIIGLGALKFEMIKVDAKSIITFDAEKALSFDGYTSAYIQYAYARIQSIFRKKSPLSRGVAEGRGVLANVGEKLSEIKEKELLKKLSKYPEIVKAAAENYNPSEIAKYVFELTQDFNNYYHEIPVLQAEEEIKNARLALLSSVAQVIKNGLGLLGIEVAEEM